MIDKITNIVKKYGVLTLIPILWFAFSFHQDVQELKKSQVDKDTIRKIINEEILKANKALELEIIKNYLLNR